MQIIRLELRHPCAFSGPLADARDARVTHLCHRGREAVLELHAPDAKEVDHLIASYEKIGGRVIFREPEGTAAVVQFAACACCRTGRVIPTLEGPEVLYLPPSGYAAGGKETYQFLALEGTIPRASWAELPEGVDRLGVGTRSLTAATFEEGFLVPIGSVFRDLTERQRLAIATAIARGYYRIPRAVTTRELGRALGISREAFEALLRKAENKLVAAWIPFLALEGAGRDGARPHDPATGAARKRGPRSRS